MSFEPKKITREHVLKAVEFIKINQKPLIRATGYLVKINGETFPPKDILRYAHEQLNGEHLWEYSGGESTNKYLRDMGFEIITLDKTEDVVAKMISRYKEKIKGTKLADEIYKWQLTKKYHGRPDVTAADFTKEILTINFSNLMYQTARRVLYTLAKGRPEELRNAFKSLFDDSLELEWRFNQFRSETLRIYRDMEPETIHSHHQDERTLSIYLAFYNSDKYPFFKDTYYQNYCKLIGSNTKEAGKKYSHYFELLKELIEDYILPDKELLDLKKEFLQDDCSEDNSNYILAQDILYQMLERPAGGSRRYWRIGTTNDTGKYWDLMLKEKYVSIGWVKLDDLREHNLKTRDDVANLLREFGYYNDNKGLATRKAGEVLNFFSEIKSGDVVLAQEGHKVLGIGIVTDDYEYQEGLAFPHIRPVNWQIVEPENFQNELGPQTMVFELTNTDLIEKVNMLLSGKTNKKEIMSLNTILYGPPGTGKTFLTIDLAVQIAAPEKYVPGDHKANKVIYDDLQEQGLIVFTTFHQSMCYEDFIEGIKPQEPQKEGGAISYKIIDGILKQLCKSASSLTSTTFELSYNKFLSDLKESEQGFQVPTNTETIIVSPHPNGVDLSIESKSYINTITKWGLKYVSDSQRFIGVWGVYYKAIFKLLAEKYGYQAEKKDTDKKYVLIIDEINRGNVSQIFGELITLIEEDKRLGKEEALEVTLPYSKEKFGVPSNIYLIGTMNTADRSVEALDTALRRRFSFIEMMPVYNLPGMEKEFVGFRLGDLLETINNRIEKIMDRDHQIGHSYFLNIKEEKDLMKVFKDKVIPLLQEYFYGNYERMGLVLGAGFVEKLSEGKVRFAQFAAEDYEVNEKEMYRLKQEPYIDSELFREAIEKLMK
jgi:5-methylcytosine-specific restriction protein B